MPVRSEIRAVAALADAKERARTGLMLLEGPHLAEEALRRGVLETLYWSPASREGARLAEAARRAGRPEHETADHDVARMCEVKTHAGVVATARAPRPIPLDALLAAAPRALAFEAVQDPGNVGAMARTARALGVDAFVFTPGCADPTAPKTLRASAGALLDAPRAFADVETLLAAARRSGHAVIVADVRGGASYRALTPPPKWILATANEGAGTAIPEDAAGVRRTTIPLAEGTESLNVAAAAAILLDRLRP